ncbi:aldolase [Streptomyces sp. NPDC001027]|uniref:class II aldolase/adducin family protein n=1 Tax=Streptomyces sp. NPDC001027 TaxID=3154771 RepID=UPI0033222354
MTSDLREEIVRIGRSLFERGYVHAAAGNISVRHSDGFLITPTDAPLGFLDADRLAECDLDGNQLSGARASKTLRLHRRIYAEAPDAGCVIHTHATHLVALTLLGVWSAEDVLPPLTPYYVMKVGHTPLVPYRRPGHPDVADLVAERLRRNPHLRAVMLDRLGPLVWAENPSAAMAILEELEETARIWLASGRSDSGLPAEALKDLAVTFGSHW